MVLVAGSADGPSAQRAEHAHPHAIEGGQNNGWLTGRVAGQIHVRAAAQCGRDVRAPSLHFKYGSSLNRFCFDNNGDQRSLIFSIRLRTLSMRKSSMAMPRSISFQSTGVETVALGVGRIE